MARSLTRRYRWWALAIFVLMAGNVFVELGETRIDDSDEARYGVAAYEMLSSGHWIVPTYAGEPETWNLKPPLGYWLMALSYRVLGASALAMRLPSAISALAVLALTMFCARRWYGRRRALLAGLILATTFGFLSHHGARNGDLDAALTLLVVVVMAQVHGWRRHRARPSFGSLLVTGVALGVVFLLKSFAVLPILVVVLAFVAVSDGPRSLARALPAFLLPLTIAALAWALARAQADGGSAWFLRQMVREDLIERSTRYIDRGTTSLLGYIPSMLDRFAPWPLIAAPAAAVAWRRRRRPFRPSSASLLLVLWAGIPFVLFSAVRTQHHWYMDPIYPACAVLTALALSWIWRNTPAPRRAAVAIGLIVLPLVVCEGRVLYRALVGDRMPDRQRFLASLAGYRQGPVVQLRTTFPLSHSERFLLQVVDGFEIVERDMSVAPRRGVLRLGRVAPAEIAHWVTPVAGATDDGPCDEIVAEGGGFLLCANDDPAPGSSLPAAASLVLVEALPRQSRCGRQGPARGMM